jgi:nucleotide-binding universal stress UspA family protein
MKNLLVAVDFSEHTPRVLRVAQEFAEQFACPVWLVHVVGATDYDSNVAQDQLESLADEMRAAGVDATALVLNGAIVDTLMGQVKHLDIHHIVMGTHGRGGLMEVVLGSVSKGMIQNCALPITLVPRD